MDRNRDARRASILGSNGFNRRRHRTNSLRDSPDEDGGLELQETVRLRDRVKKDRDQERDRDRDRERERERERGREGQRERDLRERSSRSKKRRAERLTSNREDTGGDEASEEESLNDDEDDEDEENATAGVRVLTQAVGSVPNHHHHGHISNLHHGHNSSFSQQQHNGNSICNTVSSNHHLQHRKSFPQNHSSAKISRAPPVWKSGDEMISVPVPRKARSASTKRSHDWISMSSNNSGGGVSGVEQIPGQASTSPARQGVGPTSTPTPPAPVSPTSPNASIRKKPKPTVNNSGPKVKPPKVAAKPSSSNPEELEIEIAEVLYGLMTQSQAPLLKKEESREINRLSSDAKSRNSSPVSNSVSANLILGSHSGPPLAVAPKRKRPRQIPENSSYGARSSSIPAKSDVDRKPKSETSSPCTEKISVSAAGKGYEMSGKSIDPQAAVSQPSVPTPIETAKMDLELKPATEDLRQSRDSVAKEEVSSTKEKESPAARAEVSHNGGDLSAAETTKPISMAAAIENRMEEKFEINLMAPPPHARPSPDRESKADLIDSPLDQKAVVSKSEANLKPTVSNYQTDRNGKSGRDNSSNGTTEEKNVNGSGEEAESNKAIKNEGNFDLRLDLENSERDAIKSQSLSQKQQQQMPPTEKSFHLTSSLPLPMSVGSWPGGLPPMGYMAPLQGVVSMEGGAVAPGHIPQPLFSQPRPKRCATHCHIARNIHYIQQCSMMNPFWPAPAGPASLFGSKPCNLIGLPGPDLHGNVAVRGANSGQDKGQNHTSIPNHVVKEKGSQPATTSDSAQKKQILVQQTLPPVAPSNLLGPAFIFPMNQQQSASPLPSGAKSPAAGVSSNTSAVTSSSPAAAVSFNFPNMGSNETPYLAILQNNGYTFPIPAGAVGAPQNYRGTQAQAMPMFNGSFYSSQMIHPSQLQHAQLQQAHQNASGSSAPPKQQQQRMQNGGAGNISSSQKTQPSQQYGHQSRPRHHEGEQGHEDSPSTTDSRGSRVSMNIYGQNFAMPIHPQNFGLMTHPVALASTGAAMSVSSNHGDKKQGSKAGLESLPAHSFAMTFGTMNGAAGPGMEWVQNHAAFQNSSEAARQNMQMMAAAAQAAHNFRDSDDGKSRGMDSSAIEDECKSSNGKALGGGGQSIAFTRSDLAYESLNAAAEANRSSRSMSTNGVGAMTVQNAHSIENAHSIQTQLQQQHMLLKQQQQQMAAIAVSRGSTNGVGAMNVQTANSIHQTQLQQQHMLLKQQQQLQQQQQQQQMAANAANRSKAAAATSNGGVYSEHLSSSSTMAAKFPTGFTQNLVQSNSSSSPSQSPQWKASGRTSTPSSATPTPKNLPHQHSRTQAPMHTQISFGGNQKPSAASQGQAHLANNQTTSSQMMVGSPTTSSVSRGASGSPRTTSSASTTNKVGQAQPGNNSPSVPNQKSTSILGNPQVAGAAAPAPGSVQKSQLQHQQMPKAMQQQFFFSNPYAQSQSPQASKSSTPFGSSGYYMTRRQNEQHQQSPGAPLTSAGGLSLCPPASTNDPATAIAAATANVKGGGLPSQGINHAPQFAVHPAGTMLPAGFSYAHPVPTAVQVKPAEQKQPSGNDNLRPWQSEKK